MATKHIHSYMREIILVGQYFGIMPLYNVDDSQRCSSLKFVYSLSVLLLILVNIIFLIYTLLKNGIVTYRLVTTVFYICSLVTIILFLQISKKWLRLMEHWRKVEIYMRRNYKQDTKLYLKLDVVKYGCLILGIVEYFLALSNNVYIEVCNKQESGVESYMRVHFDYIFHTVQYSHIFAFVLLVNNSTCNFIWNFADMFLIIACIALAEKFKQFNTRLYLLNDREQQTNHKHIFIPKSESFWRGVREDYDKICQVCYHLDQVLSKVIIISYINNMLFILLQLFNGIKLIRNPAEAAYFYFSFIYVVGRITAITICASSINEESRKAITFLDSLPTDIYNNEIERLIYQIEGDAVVLTGNNFFKIKRGFVLSVAAAIVTYELVLLQFNSSNNLVFIKEKDYCV